MQSVERISESFQFLEAKRAFGRSNLQLPPGVTEHMPLASRLAPIQRGVASGKFDRRTFLWASVLAAAGLAVDSISPELFRTPEDGRQQIGDLWLQEDHYSIYNLLRAENGRHIILQKPGFVYWDDFLANGPDSRASLYAEWFKSGGDLGKFMVPELVRGDEGLNLKIQTEQRAISQRGIFRKASQISMFGEYNQPTLRVTDEKTGYWFMAYTIYLDEGGQPKKDEKGGVILGLPLRYLDQASMQEAPEIQETLPGSTLMFTCDTGLTTPVGVFWGYEDTLHVGEPLIVVNYPYNYLMVEFAQTS